MNIYEISLEIQYSLNSRILENIIYTLFSKEKIIFFLKNYIKQNYHFSFAYKFQIFLLKLLFFNQHH